MFLVSRRSQTVSSILIAHASDVDSSEYLRRQTEKGYDRGTEREGGKPPTTRSIIIGYVVTWYYYDGRQHKSFAGIVRLDPETRPGCSKDPHTPLSSKPSPHILDCPTITSCYPRHPPYYL